MTIDKNELAFTISLLQPHPKDVEEVAQLALAIDERCKGHCTRVVVNALVVVAASFVTRLPASCWETMSAAISRCIYETAILGE